ncbi:MAG: hypothetical protein CME88_01205 [Hirschia sp.]|nr:hypothetical protein [Hirschia sp.]MBF16978.1 hypothetical protein [Hirschia sp.]|tara:strand:- start:458 stop:778 length:321 start_codon:yes stop_codon:yes gene_type:complete
MCTSIARVPTNSAPRYLQQLCKHWSHNLDVEFTGETGRITFPKTLPGSEWASEGYLTLQAHDELLECRLSAGVAEQIELLKKIVESHLDRFAFREAPLTFDWQDQT